MSIVESRVKVADVAEALALFGTATLCRLPPGATIVSMPRMVNDEFVTTYEDPNEPEPTVEFRVGYRSAP